jgi:DNA replication protein DnaC
LAHERFQCDLRLWRAWKRNSGVPARGLSRTLDNFQPLGKTQQAIHRGITGYANDIRDRVASGCGLTLLGSPGVGKTHLLYGLVVAAYAARIHARYMVWADVLDRTKAAFGSRDEDRKLIEQLKRAPLLALDEIGVRTGSEFDQGLLFDLIDTRYRNQRATLVASNLTEASLNGIGERTADRLREANTTLTIPGESQRTAAGMNRALIDAPVAIEEPIPPSDTYRVHICGEWIQRVLIAGEQASKIREAA